MEPQAAGQFLCSIWKQKLLFEHHSNQVWYLLEPSEKNNALNFESQLKNWVAQPLHAPVSLTCRPCPKRENTIFLIKCCEYMRNNVWQQNEINVLKFWFLFFLPNWVEIDICAFANKGLSDGEIKIFISCLIFVYHSKNACSKSFHFRCVSS